MNKLKKIGGEFEIDPNILVGYADYCLPNNQPYLYSRGRNALMVILNHLLKKNKNVIHLPYYICKSVVDTCINANFKIEFYELDSDFLFPIDYLDKIRNKEVLLTVNYFGFIDDNLIIKNIKEQRPDIVTISDQVQSFWTFEKTEADYSFTSLCKHFATTEGAMINSKNKLLSFDKHLNESSFSSCKFIGGLLKNLKISDEIYLKFFKEGEEKLNDEKEPTRAAVLSHYLYEQLDLEAIKKKRINNYKIVYDIGYKIGLRFIFPYDDKVVPLNVPILLNERDKVREKLMNKNIYLPVHWPIQKYNSKSFFVKNLSNRELSIVIDQRYSTEEIEYQMEQLKSLL
jgi:hypothetical protein